MRKVPQTNDSPNLQGLKQEDINGFLEEIAQLMVRMPTHSPGTQSQTAQSHECSTE